MPFTLIAIAIILLAPHLADGVSSQRGRNVATLALVALAVLFVLLGIITAPWESVNL